jgi:hypothetical protein
MKGSGHMVPQFKAKAAFEMLQRFLRNEPLKKYDPKSHYSTKTLDDEASSVALRS